MFYQAVLQATDLSDDPVMASQHDRALWETQKERIAGAIKRKTSAEWAEKFAGTEVCWAPVLDMEEATRHPHYVGRQTFIEIEGMMQPAPAPRSSRTALDRPTTPKQGSQETHRLLLDLGLPEDEADQLLRAQIVG